MANRKVKNKKNNSKSKNSKLQRKNKKKKVELKNKKNLLPLILSEKEQDKIKSKAIGGCKRAVSALRKAEAELENYYSEDTPLFNNWQKEFLSKENNEILKIKEKLQVKNEILFKIDREVDYNGITVEEAYTKVMSKDYEFVNSFEDEDDEDFDFDFDFDFHDIDDDEDEDFGFYDDDDDDDDEELMRSMFKNIFDEFFDSNHDFEEEYEKFRNNTQEKFNPNKGNDKEDCDLRVTVLYRELVKILHPDLRSNKNPFFDELWHICQSAYTNSDLEELKQAYALAKLYSDKEARSLPLSDLEQAKTKIASKTKGIRKDLRNLKKDIAFGFSKKDEKQKDTLLKQAKGEFKEMKNYYQSQLEAISNYLLRIEKRAKNIKNHKQKNKVSEQIFF